MITIHQPAIAVNDTRDFGLAQMWNTYKVQPHFTRSEITSNLRHVARSAPGGRVKSIVICCHGNPGSLQLGEGFDRSNAGAFGRLAGMVEIIWIRACRFAAIDSPNSETAGDGNLFCSEIARNARCYVFASSADQMTDARFLPFGKLDNFEGAVFQYGPQGNVIGTPQLLPSHNWSHD
jgi:hypothetical protein